MCRSRRAAPATSPPSRLTFSRGCCIVGLAPCCKSSRRTKPVPLLLPGVRFAVDAYVNFVGTRPWIEGVAASLTELFAPKIHKERISGMLENYPTFIDDKVMAYFKRRLTQAPRDADFALDYVLKNAKTRD